MPAATTPERTTAPAEETYHLELKPGPDPYKRHHGSERSPIYRLKRLLKYAARDCGFKINYGQSSPPIELIERTETEDAMIRFTDGPAGGKPLMLRRAPVFLRVVFDTLTQKWDALDQLADKPAAGEAIFVYRRVGKASAAMVDWTEKGKRRGACLAVATYAMVAEQPDNATMRDTEKWQAWCWAQVKAGAKPQPAGGTCQAKSTSTCSSSKTASPSTSTGSSG